MTDGNVIYFDDVKLEIREQEKPHEFSEWLNIVRDGVKSKDEMTFGNGTFTTFTGRDGVPGIDQPARIVTDPLGVEPVLSVSSVAATYMRENKDEEGNVTGTTPMYVVREGNLNSGVNVGDSLARRLNSLSMHAQIIPPISKHRFTEVLVTTSTISCSVTSP